MLPSILARQYQEGLIDYIDTSFPITNSIFKDSLRNMLNTKDSVFHTVLGSIIAEEEQPVVEEVAEIVMDERWNQIMDEFIDDIAVTCATEMKKNGIPAPSTIGFELSGKSDGATIAEAEMVWENRKIAWLLPEQEEYADIFKTNGWTVIYSSEKVDINVFGGDGK